MKVKKLLLATLVLGIGLVSCQEKIGVEDGLIDVVLSPTANDHTPPAVAGTTSVGIDPETKLGVISGGSTSWHKNDEVIIVDDGGIPRTFIAKTGGTSAVFNGKLLAGREDVKYYAFHSAINSPIDLDGYHRTITVTRDKELEYHCDDDLNAIRKGEYCSMVALPLTFDAAKPSDFKRFSFYHVNTLIEARVEREIGEYNLNNMVFNKVVFTVQAFDPSGSEDVYKPFNTEVTLDMKDITFNLADGQYSEIRIPFKDGSEKTNMMTTTITYDDNTKFADRVTKETNCYDIHIYALPTTSKFKYIADIYFYNGEETVCHLQYTGKQTANGLNFAALNYVPFNAENCVVVGPVM